MRFGLSRRVVFGLVLILAFASCREIPDEIPVSTRRPNVIVISIDALGAAHVGSYGNDRDATPFLDRLTSEGTRFSRAFVNTHGTTPSHTTMLSGTYQETHRVSFGTVTDAAEDHVIPIPDEIPYLPEVLAQSGYCTVGVTDGGNLGAKFGFSRGFERFSDEGGGIAAVTGRMLQEIQRCDDDRPLFLFLHTYEVHSPYEPPDEAVLEISDRVPEVDSSSSRLLEFAHSSWKLPPGELDSLGLLYDAGLRYVDDQLAKFFAGLERMGVLDDAIVMVTSDHGEELGEHGGLLHRDLLYEELVHIPWIARGRRIPSGVVRDQMVSLVDLAPTVLALVEVPVPDQMEGMPVLPVTPDRELVFAQYGQSRYMVRSGRWKLIESFSERKLELYDLESDPGETRNLAAERTEIVDRYRRELRRWLQERTPVAGASEPVQLDEEEVERLKALGYLGGE